MVKGLKNLMVRVIKLIKKHNEDIILTFLHQGHLPVKKNLPGKKINLAKKSTWQKNQPGKKINLAKKIYLAKNLPDKKIYPAKKST